MGMQGPLTAQALGRSPFDEFPETSDQDSGAPLDDEPSGQQYDHRGRPINPESKKISRDIIRSHNEVMLVIGVAEADEPDNGPEAIACLRLEIEETQKAMTLSTVASQCVQTVGLLGLHGFKQRVLVFRKYSETPFWELFARARKDGNLLHRSVLAGLPTGFVSAYLEQAVGDLWADRPDRAEARQTVYELWTYIRTHLELYVAMQGLGLIQNSLRLPHLSFFVPFTAYSPIPPPPPLKDLSLASIFSWAGSLCVSATPFLLWATGRQLYSLWRPIIQEIIYSLLPNTHMSSSQAPQPLAHMLPSTTGGGGGGGSGGTAEVARPEPTQDRRNDDVSPLRTMDELPSDPGPVEAVRRPSNFSARGDEYVSEEEDNENDPNPTLISFDVEATEATEAPAGGVWSAELRPSAAPNQAPRPPTFHDSFLTRFPPMLGASILTDSLCRLIFAPFDAVVLRLIARRFRQRQGLPVHDIYTGFSGLNWTSLTTFLLSEGFQFLLTGEIWAVFSGLSQYLHWKLRALKYKLGEEG